MSEILSLDAYREALARTFVPLDAIPLEGQFSARVYAEQLGDLQLSVVSGSAQVVRRTPRLVRRSAGDVWKVGVQVKGTGHLEQAGRVAELAPGDLAVYDTAHPYELVFRDDFEMLVLVVPRHRLAVRAPGIADLTAVTISGQQGSGALTSSMLRNLDPRSARPGPEAAYLGEAAVDLLAASLAGSAELRPASADSIVLGAQTYIDDHLADPSLGPLEIAAASHVSVDSCRRRSSSAALPSPSGRLDRGLSGHGRSGAVRPHLPCALRHHAPRTSAGQSRGLIGAAQ